MENIMEFVMQSSEIGKLAEALSKAQAQMQGAVKDSSNPFFKSKYADLSSVWNSCREPLTNNGLTVIQTTDGADGVIELITTLAHTSGQFIRGRLPLRPVKNDPQGIGSAISYARRYGLSSIVGVIQEDDDGERAMDRNNKTNRPTTTTTYSKTINQYQVKQLTELVNQLGGNHRDFIDWLKRTNPQLSNVSTYSDLPISHFQVAMQALDKKAAKNNGSSQPVQTTH
jgi:hypothetical protein